MNQDLQNLEIKVENDGATPQGRLTATEWNILVAAVKSLDLTGGSADAASILQVVANAGYAKQKWVTSQKYITSSALDNLAKNLVTLDTTQAITGMKDFTNGLKIGGVSVYKSKEGIVFVDGNLAVRGAVTIYADNGQAAPSIWDAFPYDDETIKRNAAGKFYAVGRGGSGTGGLDYEMLDDYLEDKGFITGITGAMVTNALGYTPLSTSGGTITGEVTISCAANTPLKINSNATDSGVCFNHNGISKTWVGFEAFRGSVLYHSVGSHRLGINNDGVAFYDSNTLLHSGNYSEYAVKKNMGINTAIADNEYGYGYFDGGWPEAGPAMVFGVGNYKAGISVGALGSAIRFGYTAGTTSFTWRTILDDNNYSDYALPITGGTISGDLDIGGSVYSSVGNLRIKARNSTMAGVEIAVSDNDFWQISHRGSFANNELHFYHNANGIWSNSVLSLSVNGDVATGGNLLIKGALTMNYSSDERLKKNIRKVNASEVLMSLGGVWQYEYIDSEVQKNSVYDGTHFGLIYQNVKGTSLDIMCHEREDSFGTLNYLDANFISLVAGATMENISEVEKLKKENKALRKRVEQLEKRIA